MSRELTKQADQLMERFFAIGMRYARPSSMTPSAESELRALALDAIAAAHRSAVVALVDGDREQEGTVVPTTRYMECKCLPDSHVPPNPFCEVHGRPSIAAPSGQGVGEEALAEKMRAWAVEHFRAHSNHEAARWLIHEEGVRPLAAIAVAALATPPAPQEDTRDAERWRALRPFLHVEQDGDEEGSWCDLLLTDDDTGEDAVELSPPCGHTPEAFVDRLIQAPHERIGFTPFPLDTALPSNPSGEEKHDG